MLLFLFFPPHVGVLYFLFYPSQIIVKLNRNVSICPNWYAAQNRDSRNRGRKVPPLFSQDYTFTWVTYIDNQKESWTSISCYLIPLAGQLVQQFQGGGWETNFLLLTINEDQVSKPWSSAFLPTLLLTEVQQLMKSTCKKLFRITRYVIITHPILISHS